MDGNRIACYCARSLVFPTDVVVYELAAGNNVRLYKFLTSSDGINYGGAGIGSRYLANGVLAEA